MKLQPLIIFPSKSHKWECVGGAVDKGCVANPPSTSACTFSHVLIIIIMIVITNKTNITINSIYLFSALQSLC